MSYVNKQAMAQKYKPTREQSLDFLKYVLIEDNNDKTVVPFYFLERRGELIQELAAMGIRAEIYFIEKAGYYIRKII